MLGLAKQEPYEPQDTLMIYKDEDGTADVATVIDVNDERLYAENAITSYTIPVGQYKTYTGRKGRIFVVGAPLDAVSDYQRIAALERSTVLRQITHYQGDPPEPVRKPIGRYILIGLAVMVFLIILKAV
ncbi:hypothetical protein KIH86_25365 [Paenibacillus sp. HN-1]|uniref:hypothetical protein n=1 Tax=Paenibacillus TaxID=44249 RepID=UPI001CA7C7E9|nr:MULTISPECIES: hypothetical protein [Paenibacillus]MBY9082623.1 hypothetical protein [Paenibacillus sp. CGMCC 1.18879]MBY9087521.1 hypothetical protein [Paenibacillus sinensis]